MGSLNNIIWFIIACIVVYAACQTITQTAAEWSHYRIRRRGPPLLSGG